MYQSKLDLKDLSDFDLKYLAVDALNEFIKRNANDPNSNYIVNEVCDALDRVERLAIPIKKVEGK